MHKVTLPCYGARPSPNRWLTSGLVTMQPDAVRHEMRAYQMSGVNPRAAQEQLVRAPPKTRCLVAVKGFVRGERICTIERGHILTGQRAADVLHRLSSSSSASSPSLLPAFDDIVSALHACPGSAPLLTTRDSLLVMLALYALHRCPQPPPDDPLAALWQWVACMPPRVAPLGTLAVQHVDGVHSFHALQRRLRVGDISQPLLPGESVTTAKTDLMVRAVEEGGLEALREPQVEAMLTEEMRVNLYEGRRSALTVRQFEEAAARTLRTSASTTAQRLLFLESQLDQTVLKPLTRLLQATTRHDSGRGEWQQSAEADALRWAHFMTRSRAVNARGGQEPRSSGGDSLTMQVAVVPFLDMLNHTYKSPNVSFYLDDAADQLVVTARRRVAAGEELTLHYGSVPQRQCLFGDVPAAVDARAQGSAIQRDVRRMEKRQRYELIDEDDTETSAQVASTASASASPAAHTASEREKAEQEAVREVDWLWRFGFFRSKEEKAYEASNRWSHGLRKRIADLTDVRRKGRPGEFVIGVPEGLEHLREQRERLERERYNNTKVFPPQRS